MQPGYYWADHAIRGWRIVEVVKGLFGCVLEGGYAVSMANLCQWQGQGPPPNSTQRRPSYTICGLERGCDDD
jgi:hypothetical protein